jgi:hypothetical protein
MRAFLFYSAIFSLVPSCSNNQASNESESDSDSHPTGNDSETDTGSDVDADADTDSDADSDTDTDSEAWRPFSNDSPWNTPIPDNPAIDPNSDALIADFETSSEWGEHLDVNIGGYSIPLYWADENTPLTEVRCDIGGMGFSGDNGMDATAMVPIPDSAAPDPESDHHLLIVDRSTNLEWGMWNTVNDNGTWTCGLGANIDLLGTGVRPNATQNPTWYTSHGARACGFPLVAGLIRMEEIEAGKIEHALIVAYPHIRSGWFTPPASTAQASNGQGAEPDRGIPCGGRIQLDPRIDLDTLGLTRSGRIICLALQKYGAYVGDYSGAMSLYAENSPEAQDYWASGVLDTYELQDIIDIAWFRVIEQGELFDNGNGK